MAGSGWTGTSPSDWVRETKERIQAVHRGSVQALAAEMTQTIPNGGRVPVKTGNLARSLLASTSGMPTTGPGPFTGGDVGPVLLTLEPGDTVWLGWQARYAYRMNYGFVGEDSLGRNYNQSGFGFAEAAAANWSQIVDRVTIEIRGAQ